MLALFTKLFRQDGTLSSQPGFFFVFPENLQADTRQELNKCKQVLPKAANSGDLMMQSRLELRVFTLESRLAKNTSAMVRAVNGQRSAQVARWKAIHNQKIARYKKDISDASETQRLIPSTSSTLRRATNDDLLGARKALTEVEDQWNEEEKREQAAEMYPYFEINAVFEYTCKPPTVELLRNQITDQLSDEGIVLQPKKKLRLAQRPTGLDGMMDMRFLSVERPAAQLVKNSLRNLQRGFGLRNFAFGDLSGSGKTSVAFEVAKDIFTLYFVCRPSDESLFTTKVSKIDHSTFPLLEKEVIKRASPILTKVERTTEARRIASILLVSHLYLLHHFLCINPKGTPDQFLVWQLSDKAHVVVEKCFTELRSLSQRAAESFAHGLRHTIDKQLPRTKKTLVLAIDEIENAVKVMPDDFALRERTLDGKCKPGRGLSTPLLQAACDLRGAAAWCLLTLGTEAVWMRSPPDPNNIAKYSPYFYNFELFPMASKQNVHETLKSCLKLDGAVVDQVVEISKYLYDARFSLLSKTIEEFAAIKFEATSCERLSIAIERSVKAHKQDLLRLLKERAFTANMQLDRVFLEDLHDAYVSARMTNGAFVSDHCLRSAPYKSHRFKREDWCQWGIARLDNDDEFRITEQLVFETIEEFFETLPSETESIAFKQSVKDFDSIMAWHKSTSASRDVLRSIIFHTLELYNDRSISELPFVQLMRESPAWERWRKVKVNIRHVVYQSETTDDASFLLNRPKGTLFSPSKIHGAHGLSLFETGDLLAIGATLYCKSVPYKVADSQYGSTDPSLAYKFEKEDMFIDSRPARKSWGEHGLQEKVAFRLHVNLPDARLPMEDSLKYRVKPGTRVLPDQSLVVNIDLSNIDKFLKVINDAELRKAIYRLLYRITRDPRLNDLLSCCL